jgi:uncharacterized protein (DUF1778 family)
VASKRVGAGLFASR